MPGQFILGIAGLLLLGAGITVLGGAVWRWRRKKRGAVSHRTAWGRTHDATT